MNILPGRIARMVPAVVLLAVSAQAAQPGAAWLEIGPGGRAAGLAEAMTAAVEGPTATYWNPAAVGFGASGVEAMVADWGLTGGKVQYLAGVFRGHRLGWGVSLLHVGTGDLELRTRPSAAPVGSFTARSYAFGGTLALALPWGGLRAGASGRYLVDEIHIYDTEGWSLDLGLLRPGLLDGRLDLAVTVRHLGRMKAFLEEACDLPTTYTAGARYRPGALGRVKPSLMLDVARVADYDPSVRGAVEAVLFDAVALRAGYATGYEARGLSAGLGLAWRGWRFDYGYTPFAEDLGNAQRISVARTW